MRPTAQSSLPPFSISSISASPRMTRLRMIRLRSGSRLIRHDRALSGDGLHGRSGSSPPLRRSGALRHPVAGSFLPAIPADRTNVWSGVQFG
jgi:hypothetical protein